MYINVLKKLNFIQSFKMFYEICLIHDFDWRF